MSGQHLHSSSQMPGLPVVATKWLGGQIVRIGDAVSHDIDANCCLSSLFVYRPLLGAAGEQHSGAGFPRTACNGAPIIFL